MVTQFRSQRCRLELNTLEDRITPSITVRFDYTFDNTGFFDQPEAREAMQRAADQFAPRLHDTLAPIVPSGNNTWQAIVTNPVNNARLAFDNLVVQQNEVIVYATAGPVGTSELAIASSGGFTASGTQSWLNTVSGRGQEGALGPNPTDVAPWGGLIAFDDRVNWNFADGPPTSNQFDFTSVALHELLHIFGFGLGEPAFNQWISGNQFVGPHTVEVFGGPVPMPPGDDSHFAQGTTFDGREVVMVPAIRSGDFRAMSALEFAVLRDVGWEVDRPNAGSPSTPSVPGAPEADPVRLGSSPVSLAPGVGRRFTVGIGPGPVGTAFGYGTTGAPQVVPNVFGSTYVGGVRVATIDLNGNGILDAIYGTGPGVITQVRAIDGATGVVLFQVQPFESAFLGGVYVSAGDLTGDGRPNIVVSPDEGGGPRVQVYDLLSGQLIADFFGIDDPDFRGGARTAVGDLNGDGRPDLAVAAGFGGGPRVAIYDGRSVVNPLTGLVRLVPDFFVFEPQLRNGAFIAIADINGNGFGDLIAGAGPGGGPRVTIFSGAQLLNGQEVPIANFFAGDDANRGGVRVAVQDFNGDGRKDLITGAGERGDGTVLVLAGRSLAFGQTELLLRLSDNSWVIPGVFVG